MLSRLLPKVAVIGLVALALPLQAFAQEVVVVSAEEALDVGSFNQVDTDIELRVDGSALITETLDVTFNEERRGIFREIPIKYTNRSGNQVKLDTEILSVLQDGEPAATSIYQEGSEQIIRIGEASTYITGDYIYEITYVVEDGVLFFEDFDELYWNTMASGGDLSLGGFTVDLKIPDGAEIEQYSCYNGPEGSTTENCTISEEGPGKITFAASEPFSFAVGFTKGIVEEPTALESLLELLLENWWAVFGLIPGLLAFYFWSRFGKDDPMGPIITEFKPVEGLQPAEHAQIMGLSFDKHTVASMIIYLAVKGYIKITVNSEKKKPAKKDIILTRHESTEFIDVYHSDLLEMLFGEGREVKASEFSKKAKAKTMISIKTGLEGFAKTKLYDSRSLFHQGIMFTVAILFTLILFFLGERFGTVLLVTSAISCALLFVSAILMSKKSLSGIELYRNVKGFRVFIETVEKHKARWAETQNIFEDYLPYAIAFRDADHWANVFSDIRVEDLDWYQGTGSAMNTLAMYSVFNSLSNSAGSFSAAAHPKSASSGGSGSSGGGFSGGGFGGGGGGSW